MPTIKISQLSAVGSELFDDSETFLHELADEELAIMGGTSDGDTKEISAVTVSLSISVCTLGPCSQTQIRSIFTRPKPTLPTPVFTIKPFA